MKNRGWGWGWLPPPPPLKPPQKRFSDPRVGGGGGRGVEPPPPPAYAPDYQYHNNLKGLSHWRRRRRDCRDWSVAATRVTQDQKMACALTKETSQRLISRGDSGDQKWLALSPRRPQGDKVTTNSPGSSGNVAETSRRRRGDVSPVADKISLRDVAATDGDVAETSPRPAGDWNKSPKIEHWISRDSPETRLVSRRCRGDVSATSGDSSHYHVAT